MRILALLLLVILGACQTTPKEEVDLKALKNEVFDIHDEVMPEMGNLRRVRRDLMLQADSIKDLDSARAAFLIEASDNLDAANESMMNWMRNFDPNFEGTDEEVLTYLTEKREGIIQVRDDMLESLEAGQKILSEDQ